MQLLSSSSSSSSFDGCFDPDGFGVGNNVVTSIDGYAEAVDGVGEGVRKSFVVSKKDGCCDGMMVVGD